MEISVNLPTRRRALSGMALALGSIAVGRTTGAQAQMASQPKEMAPCTAPNQAKTAIHYDLEFKATPEQFYEAILDEKKFAVFSGMAATIDRTAGGAFKMFGGLIEGRNVELAPGQRIVQAWRPASWEAGLYSLVRFELKAGGAGTLLSFDHYGFPSGDFDHLDWGWKDHYWEGLRRYFG